MVPNCVPVSEQELEEDLKKWFKEKWVDISRPKKGGGYMPCGRNTSKKGKYPKCVPASKAARMTPAQRKSAIRRRRAAGNPGGKPTMVRTFAKRKKRTTRRKR